MQKKAAIGLLIVILILLTGNSLYWAAQKEGYHCDETYSYGLSNSVFNYPIYDGEGNVRWNTPEDIKGYMVVPEDGGFDYAKVYKNQTDDVHPPFFYIIMHTISSFFLNSYSLYIGIIPNLVFTIGTCILLYVTAMLILKKRGWALLAVLCYALSVHCVNMVTYVRMYAMLTFFVTATVYLHLRLMENQYVCTPRLAVMLFGTVFLGAYTQYYYFIFIVPVAIFCVAGMWRQWKKMLHYIMGMAITAVVYIMAWPAFFKHIFSTDRGEEAFQNAVSGSFLANLKEYIGVICEGMGAVFFNIFLLSLLICIVHVYWNRKNKIKNTQSGKALCLIAIACLFYFAVISKISPYRSDRYIAPVVPFVCLFLSVLLSSAVRFVCGKRIGMVKLIAIGLTALLCGGLYANTMSRLADRRADSEGANYLYRASEGYRDFLEKAEGKPCIMVHEHEAQFLLNLPDYMHFSKTAFVYEPELKKIKKNNPLRKEEDCILYVNNGLDGDTVAETIQELLGFDAFEMLVWNDGRSWVNVYRVYREERPKPIAGEEK